MSPELSSAWLNAVERVLDRLEDPALAIRGREPALADLAPDLLEPRPGSALLLARQLAEPVDDQGDLAHEGDEPLVRAVGDGGLQELEQEGPDRRGGVLAAEASVLACARHAADDARRRTREHRRRERDGGRTGAQAAKLVVLLVERRVDRRVDARLTRRERVPDHEGEDRVQGTVPDERGEEAVEDRVAEVAVDGREAERALPPGHGLSGRLVEDAGLTHVQRPLSRERRPAISEAPAAPLGGGPGIGDGEKRRSRERSLDGDEDRRCIDG